ncbi:MAG TPA: hypothetical protein VOA87_22660 [Thermoanaerobaculia bacterium]|nr:hypothetical protein [Thermoanaerobaculia bacterium]
MLFFGNSVDASLRLSDLEQFREYLDGYLRTESEFMSSLHSDLEIDMVPLFAETFPPLLHSAIITSTVSLVELEVRGYCEAMRNSLGLALRVSELSGALLDRFWRYCGKVIGLQLDADRLRWADLVGLFELRNCLVHVGGDLAEFQGASVVRAFAGRHGTPNLEGRSMAINSKTSVVALEIASVFLDEIFDLALARFPGQYLPRLGS